MVVCIFSSLFSLLFKACTDASRFDFVYFINASRSTGFFYSATRRLAMDWMGSLGVVLFMYCILSCLHVLRQLDRRSIASQTPLPLKVIGTINEHTIKRITIFVNSNFSPFALARHEYARSAASDRSLQPQRPKLAIATADLPHFSQGFLGRTHHRRHFHTMRQFALRNTPSDFVLRDEQSRKRAHSR